MSEYVSKLIQIPEEELQPATPAESSRLHELPLYVIAFTEPPEDDDTLNEPLVITLPSGRIMRDKRTAVVSIQDTATQVAERHQIIAVPYGKLELPYDATTPCSQGFSVRHDSKAALPDMADFTRTAHHEDHGLPLEIHTHSRLVQRLEAMPGREIEVAYLRKFGELALGQQA